MEKEFTDPAPYYYTGSGQFYSPQLVRSLSETGQTSSSGNNGGPSGSAIAGPSGSSGSGFNPASVSNIETSAENVGGGAAAGALAGLYIGTEAGPIGALAGAVIGATIGAVASFFEEIFGGGSDSAQIPRQLLHGSHPLYRDIVGVPVGLITDEASAPVLAKCDLVQSPPSGTLALATALEAAGEADALGGGPENPAADLIATSILVYAGATACYEEYQSYAKGGKQNLRESGEEGLEDDEISRRAHDPSLPPQERKKYQRLEKVKKLRNKQKRK